MAERKKTDTVSPGLTRREFLACSALTSAALFTGCAIDPVTGRQQLMMVSPDQELAIDRQYSPHQISGDYGDVQDSNLIAYVDGVGRGVARFTHRPQMPYRFHPVNATYVNAYAFPGGTIGITRGILLGLPSEAALASLLGHEMGHVNARHTAEQMTKGTLTNLILAGASAYIGSRTGYGRLASDLGRVAGGALLAHYSRDNEREADALGLKYMVDAGYGPQGQVELMELLRSLHKKRPSALDLMFATHPMSEERYQTVVQAVGGMPAAVRDLPLHRERHMDNTASLRALGDVIEQLQKGEKSLAGKKYGEAESHFAAALKKAPGDYAGMLMMSRCQLALERFGEMDRYAEEAKAAYPGEAQAYKMGGLAKMLRKRYEAAYADFSRFDELLPGNPEIFFYKGLALEKMGRRDEAAGQYKQYLQRVNRGQNAQHAAQRLREWGYIR
jgi:predicted Zn-dependent protease